MIVALLALVVGLWLGAFVAGVAAVLVCMARLEQLEDALDVPRRDELGARWVAVLAAARSSRAPSVALTEDEREGLRRLAEIPDGAWSLDVLGQLHRAAQCRDTNNQVDDVTSRKVTR